MAWEGIAIPSWAYLSKFDERGLFQIPESNCRYR